MRYKEKIEGAVEAALQRVDIIQRGIESRQLDSVEISKIIDQIKFNLTGAKELLELEHES